MALINCEECGKEVSDIAKACPHCGYPIKKKGKGFAVTRLVLGIIGCVYSLPTATATLQPDITINKALAMITYMMIINGLSLIFGIASHNKGCKLKKKTAGIILSVISIVILLISIVIKLL